MNQNKLKTLLEDTIQGHRLTVREAEDLFKSKGSDVWEIVSAADRLREEKVGDTVTYVRNQNIHITNICKNLCGFCGFGKPKNSKDAFIFNTEDIIKGAMLAKERDVTEVCLLSGVHPDFDVEKCADIIRTIHRVIPDVDIHAMSPDEIIHCADKSGISTEEVLEIFRDAGIGTLQGTAAEMLVDEVRKIICPLKLSTSQWVKIIKEAHNMGMKSTATIMYGTIEKGSDRAVHLGILRDIQDETGGFTELVTLPFLYKNTKLYERGLTPAGATGREDILMFAVSRLFLDNFDNVQVAWGKLGNKFTQLALMAGANDFGGTMFMDSVSVEAGGEDSDYLDPAEMKRIAEDADRTLRQRDTKYNLI